MTMLSSTGMFLPFLSFFFFPPFLLFAVLFLNPPPPLLSLLLSSIFAYMHFVNRQTTVTNDHSLTEYAFIIQFFFFFFKQEANVHNVPNNRPHHHHPTSHSPCRSLRSPQPRLHHHPDLLHHLLCRHAHQMWIYGRHQEQFSNEGI